MKESQTIIQLYNYWNLKPLQNPALLSCCRLFGGSYARQG